MDFDNFDPTTSGGNSSGSRDKPNLPPGIYVMAVKLFKRRQKNGKESLMFVCVPLLTEKGSAIGKDDYSAVFETCTLTAEAAWRLANLCQAVGRNTPFNANSDREVSTVFIRKPFKARVVQDTYAGRVSMKIKEFMPMTERDEKRADIALEDWDINEPAGGGGGGDSYGDHDGDGYGGGAPGSSPPVADDDIPF